MPKDMLAEDMYREQILDLYKNPHNRGPLLNATNIRRAFNPSCGDDITIQMVIQEGKIEKISFIGRGCAISIAAASLLTEAVKGKNVSEAKSITQEQMIRMLEVPITPGRMKCALMAWQAVQEAIQ